MIAGESVAERFVIDRAASAGGMGQVSLARDRLSGSSVALKVLRSSGEEERERFWREATVLAELHHPAIVGYVAHGETEAHEVYLAMAWLEGEDLASFLARRGQLTVSECIAITMRTADALAAAHRVGIIHRDLKPSNIFLEHSRRSHMISCTLQVYFGLALAYGGRSTDALAEARNALERATAAQSKYLMALARGVLARIHLLRGDFDEAAREAEPIAGATSPTSMYQVESLAVLAAARVGQRRFREALDASTLGMRWMGDHGGVGYVEGTLRLAHAEALAAMRFDREAKAQIAAARDRLEARASAIADAQARRTFLERVPEHARTLSLAEPWAPKGP